MKDQFGSVPPSGRPYGSRQIYRDLKSQIITGVYKSGSLMPSTRSLAVELGVARSTVTVAYEQLLSEGFIETSPGARARVAELRADTQSGKFEQQAEPVRQLSGYGKRLKELTAGPSPGGARPGIDFRYGDLAASDFPVALWKRAVSTTVSRRRIRLAYDEPQGCLALRNALQGYLWRARGIRTDVEQIVIVNGSQQGLDISARLLLDPGDRVVVEDPCYIMARHAFLSVGASLLPVEADLEGLRTDTLSALDASMVYVTPSHQYPLGGIMPIKRRHELLAWSRRRGAYVIEDDYDSEYRYDIDPVPPMHVLEGADNVIYIGTLSKILSPTLRLGYAVVPHALSQVFSAAKRVADRHAPLLEQEAVADLIQSGSYERHVRRTRRRNATRRATLLATLRVVFGDDVSVVGTQAGLHVIVWCKRFSPEQEDGLIERARAAGIGLYPVSPTYLNPRAPYRPPYAGIVMGYAGLDERQIEKGILLLADILA